MGLKFRLLSINPAKIQLIIITDSDVKDQGIFHEI